MSSKHCDMTRSLFEHESVRNGVPQRSVFRPPGWTGQTRQGSNFEPCYRGLGLGFRLQSQKLYFTVRNREEEDSQALLEWAFVEWGGRYVFVQFWWHGM